MNHDDIDRVFGRGRLRMVTGDHVEVFREASLPGERRRYTKRFLATAAGDFRHWTEREWRILARLVGHAIGPVPDVVHYDRGLAGDKVAQVQTYDAGITVDHWATLLPVRRAGQSLDHVFQDCAHWWALARHSLIALDAIHAIGLVHLDLKADNICIPFEPAALDPLAPAPWIAPRIEQIALIDFAFSLVSGEQLTRALPIARQPDYDYQSPRLLDALDAGHRGDLGPTRELDWRCDLFSLAAMLRRYLPDPEAAPANGWTSALDARARALVRRLLQVHDGAATAQRPHAELFTFASAPLADARLAASLESGWWLARTPVDASALSPTPVTRVALPPQPERAAPPPVEPPAVPVAERIDPPAVAIDLHAEPALRVNPPPAQRRAPWGWAAAAVAVAALALPVLSGHWGGSPPPAADVPAALPPPLVTALAREAAPASPTPVVAASAAASLPAAPPPGAASQAAVVVAQAAEEAPDATAAALPPAIAPPVPAEVAPSAPEKPVVRRQPARRAELPAVAAARKPPAPSAKATKPPPARTVAGAAPRRPTAPQRAQVVARAGAAPAAPAAPAARLPAAPPSLPTAPVTLPPAPVTLPPAPVALPPAAAPAPAPAPAPAARDHAARADELLAHDLPRIAQRAERLVLPVLAAVGNGPEGDVRAAARILRVAPGDPRLEAQASSADARALHEAARQALWRRGSLQEAVELQTRAFGANPLDAEVTSRLASLWLRQHPRQPEVARQLALHALTLPDGRHPHGRPEDWTTLALANALSGREREARQAWWVLLELAPDPEQPCRAAAQAYAQYGERVRSSVEALLRRARTMGLDEESAHCEWPSHWARWR